jgi:hypothetical protein
MKGFLILFLISLVSFTVSAQKFCLKQSGNHLRSAKLPVKQIALDIPADHELDLPDFKPLSKKLKNGEAAFEALIGRTEYDLQTNCAVANRIYAYPDGTKAAVWTMGFQTSPSFDRGTGYNYFDGVSWGDMPQSRIEPVRTGWPSYCPLGNGELVVAHNSSNGLQLSQRPVRGTGTWISTSLAAPAGATKVLGPRAITNGNTIHILAVTGDPYQGLDLALLYFRSADGGTTWEIPGIILPGLDSASLGAGPGKSFNGFDYDTYAWSEPKGDTIALAVANQMGGTWIMKSIDNGVTWNKITVFEVPDFTDSPSPVFASTDGSVAAALDSQGKVHVVFGRMFVSDDDFTTGGNSYNPYTDGLIYWNENMPQLDTAQLANADALAANGNLIGWMDDVDGNGQIDFPEVGSGEFPFGLYGVSLSSMGQIIIDGEDKIYVTYSSCREDLYFPQAHPNVELYRHLYLTTKEFMTSDWSTSVDITDDIEHSYDEVVYGSLANEVNGGLASELNIVCQMDPEPGLNLGADGDEIGENYVYYLSVPYFGPSVKEADFSNDILIFPNPANEFTNLQFRLDKPDRVEISIFDIMGKQLMINNYGQQLAGYHTYQVNTSDLPSGMYFFTIKVGISQASKKVVVE